MISYIILNKTKRIIVTSVLLLQSVWAVSQPTVKKEVSRRIFDRGAHHQKIEVVREVAQINGAVKTETIQYTQIASGLNKLEDGNWVESKEILEQHPNGLVGRSGPIQVIFDRNINQPGSIDILTPDNKRLRSTVLGLYFTDTVSGESVLIGEVKDSEAKLLPPNQVIYQNAFLGIKADVLYTYGKGFFEQDVILREKPKLPNGFDLATTTLEVLTEFVEAPVPVIRTSDENDNLQAGSDSKISFGQIQFGRSLAFKAENQKNFAKEKAFIIKKWVNFGDRKFLLEKVPFSELADLMKDLPDGANNKPQNNTAKLQEIIPNERKRLSKGSESKTVELAQIDPNAKGLVLDYIVVFSTLSMIFNSDETYYVSGLVWIDDYCEFQEGCVLKYALNASLVLLGEVMGPASEDRPAVLTGYRDNTFGEDISGLPQDVSQYWAEKAIVFYLTSLSPYTTGHQQITNLDIRDATSAIEIYGDNNISIDSCVIEHCQNAIYNAYDYGSIVKFNSGAIFDVTNEKVEGFQQAVFINSEVIRGEKEINVTKSDTSSNSQGEVTVSINRNYTEGNKPSIITMLTMHDKVVEKSLTISKSTNGGASWNTPAPYTLAAGTPQFDPYIDYDNDGDLWITYVGEDVGGSVSVSVDLIKNGQQNSTRIYDKTAQGIDRPTISTIPDSNNEAWLCYSAGVNNIQRLYMLRLTEDKNQNANAIPIELGNLTTYTYFAYMGADMGNILALAAHDWEFDDAEPQRTHFTVLLAKNSMGIADESDFVECLLTDSTHQLINMPAEYRPPCVSQSYKGIDAGVGIGLDTLGKKMYVVYTDRTGPQAADPNNFDSDIYLKRLEVNYTDTLATTFFWSSPIKVNKYGLGETQFLPRMAIDQTTGHIAIAWYGCKDVDNKTPQFYLAISKNLGNTFTQARISRGKSDYSINNPNNHFDYGDFIGIDFHDGVVFPMWADNSNSTGDNPDVNGNNIEFEIHTRKIIVSN